MNGRLPSNFVGSRLTLIAPRPNGCRLEAVQVADKQHGQMASSYDNWVFLLVDLLSPQY